jgi:hypothetical protein
MPHRAWSIPFFFTIFTLLILHLPSELAGQAVPVSPVFQISPPPAADARPGRYADFSPATAALPDGGFTVGWTATFLPSDVPGPIQNDSITGRLLAADGGLGAVFAVGSTRFDPERELGPLALASTGAGTFVAAWPESRYAGADLWLQRFAAGAVPATPEPEVQGDSPDFVTSWDPFLAGTPFGAFVLGWAEIDFSATGGSAGTVTRRMARAYDLHGVPEAPARPLGPATPGESFLGPRLARTVLGHPEFLAAWPDAGTGCLARRFDLDGSPFGVEVRLPSCLFAWAPENRFITVRAGIAPVGKGRPLYLRRYAGDLTPLAPETQDGNVVDFEAPVTAADRHGNFVLAWLAGSHVKAQLFNSRGVPQGGRIDFGTAVNVVIGRDRAAAALTDAGRLLLAWSGATAVTIDGKTQLPILGRLWRVRHDADLCVVRGNRFLCDTAGDGGGAEETIAFGNGLPSDVPFLADFDGDGRADPCVRRDGRFLCDLRHDGAQAEDRSRPFGLPGDTPLLADVDGDRRADPCVFRAGVFLCDRDRDGTEDLRIAFGRPGDTALLGDADGDGRKDPCVYRAGRFNCDTAHDGGTAERQLNLRPALGGDFHGTPLFGDLDGDGRDDACLFRGGRLTCGLFPAAGGTPLAVIERTLGTAGDVPLLGDLDAF